VERAGFLIARPLVATAGVDERDRPTLKSRFVPGPVVLAALLLGVALVTWIVTVERMDGMDAGPGTDLGGLGWYVGIWVTMMAAMMLPSVAPMALVFAHVSSQRAHHRGEGAVSTWFLLAGYLAAWTAYGLAAYGLYRAVKAWDPAFLSWDHQGPVVAGTAIAAAGLYQLTPLKRACLRRCRSPLAFVLERWRDGTAGALRMGVEHGGYCLGCCALLMALLFVGGLMNLLWAAAIAAWVLLEKVLPAGELMARGAGGLAVAFGVWMMARALG
jgi:predicted metal-binding membrane protein